MLPLIALTYLTSRGLPLAGALRSLGLGKGKLSITTIVTIGIGVFLAILGVEIALSLFQAVTNISLPTNVQSLLQGQALYYIVFAALIGPINEEIFFRGFLVPRFGIVLSALLFMMLHSGYASVAELIGAFVFGLLAGYVFKRTGSLYTTIIGHILVNSMALFFIMAI
jgi:membrane protease YdiL (CAAX protease family)